MDIHLHRFYKFTHDGTKVKGIVNATTHNPQLAPLTKLCHLAFWLPKR